MTRDASSFIPVSCQGALHHLQITPQGRLRLLNHPGSRRAARAYAALAGEAIPCLEVARVWRRVEVPWLPHSDFWVVDDTSVLDILWAKELVPSSLQKKILGVQPAAFCVLAARLRPDGRLMADLARVLYAGHDEWHLIWYAPLPGKTP